MTRLPRRVVLQWERKHTECAHTLFLFPILRSFAFFSLEIARWLVKNLLRRRLKVVVYGGWEGQATFALVAAVVVRSHRAHHSVRHIVQEVFEKRVILDYLISEHPDIG